MKNKLYAVHPNYVYSANDKDIHFISYSKLIQLYNVNPKECFRWIDKRDTRTLNYGDYIHLIPKKYGDYSIKS